METLNDFYQGLIAEAAFDAEINGLSKEDALTSSFLEFIKESNETDSPEILNVKTDKESAKTLGDIRLNAFDYSEMSGILDLFACHFKMGESVDTITASTMDRMVGYLNRFMSEAVKGTISKYYRESRPEVAEFTDLVLDEYKNKHIKNIRMFILTDCKCKDEFEYDDIQYTDQNINTEYHIWDIRRVMQAEQAGRHMSEIMIQLDPPVECIKVNDGNENVNTYLGIIPAITIAKAYAEHKDRLIESNVRNYLGSRIKVNAQIAATLREKPEMFFAYNNGISSIASEVDIKEVGEGDSRRMFITQMRNLKIVNGGQTTCTIYNTYKNRNKVPVDLTKAFLSMKVSEIKEKASSQKMVPDIAKSANSQTAIKDSDLNANAKYLTDLDEISKSEWTPAISARPNTLWYFERLRGQFISDKLNEGDARSAKVKKFLDARPKSQILSKTDIAKVKMSWDGFPYEASKGNEVCFYNFWKKDYKNDEVTREYFQDIVALRILYLTIHRLFLEAGYKGYANIVDNYVLATIGVKTGKKLDLGAIWKAQTIQKELEEPIKECIKIMTDYIAKIGQEGANPSVSAKRLDFWNQVQIQMANVKFPTGSSVVKSTHDELTPDQKKTIDDVVAVGADNWRKLSEWGRTSRKMSIMERKRIDHMVVSLEKDVESIQYMTAASCLQILRMSEEAGFKK